MDSSPEAEAPREMAASARPRPLDWRALVLELGVVFFGVTAAFLLNNWNEGRQQQHRAQKYLQGFAQDLASDRQQLEQLLPGLDTKLKALDSLIFAPDEQAPWTPEQAFDVFRHIVANVVAVPTRGTYETLRNSGSLSLISDYALRATLVEYYEQLPLVENKVDLLQDWTLNRVMPFAIEHFDIVQSRVLDPEAVSGPRFRNLALSYRSLLQQQRDAYRELLDANRRTADAVAAALPRPQRSAETEHQE
ncbi:MAG: DUF6090 family protein [Pseudomonadota bacterium]|nr:DUF6090 family protein [Pseudomonadota bacterium]